MSGRRQLRKLTEADLGEIYARANAGESHSALARDHGVAPQTISYHLRMMKEPGCPYARALVSAADDRRKGKLRAAACHLRSAARHLEKIARKDAQLAQQLDRVAA